MKKLLFTSAMKRFSLLLILIILISCEKNQPPTCTIVVPAEDTEIEIGETVIIRVIPFDSDGSITEVRFYINDIDVGSANSYPYNYHWNTSDVEMGSHTIGATVKDNNGASAADEIVVLIIEERIIGPVTDVDGNVYQTVKIGTQWWMAENLKTTKYNDGSPIPLVTDNTAWSNLTTPGYCWYENSTANRDTYGGLYTWAAAMNGAAGSTPNSNGIQGVCPAGWHVPSSLEWRNLTDYLGGEGVAGGKLKETGTIHWADPNTGATNESGFTALPGGLRSYSGVFKNVGYYGYWWSSSQYDAYMIWYWSMHYNADVSNYFTGKIAGFSVRCVLD